MNKKLLICILFIHVVVTAQAQPHNLLTQSRVKVVVENGIMISMSDSPGQVKVLASPNPRDPSIYLVTLPVEPGKEYTYFLKGVKSDSARVFLYVTSPKGNLVWPGGELENGFARSTFTIPADVNEITLATTFLHPNKKRSVVIEDIGLFQGNVSEWPPRRDPLDFSFLLRSSSPYTVWLLVLSVTVLAAVIFLNNKISKKAASTI